MDGRRLLWTAAGCPPVIAPDGTPVPRDESPARCARCGADGAPFDYGDVFSEAFWPARTINQLQGYGGRRFCDACAWSVRCLPLRCAAWIAAPGGVWFLAQRDVLAALLDPPEPPFVVAWPRYGIAHGGEVHAWRAHFRGGDPIGDAERLGRLQAKHAGIYAETAYSRDRYPLQVDDVLSLTVDRALWTRLARELDVVVRLLHAEGLGPRSIRECLTSLTPPERRSLALARDFARLTAPFRAHRRAQWWEPLVALLPVPDMLPRAPKVVAPVLPKAAPIVAPQSPAPRAQLTLF